MGPMSDELSHRRTNLLYHYTDQHGLLGIVERRELWATNLGCLSDISEFKHGLESYEGLVTKSLQNCFPITTKRIHERRAASAFSST